jgi:ABC-type uncharacterized transport system substrate-binding protein
MIRSLRPLIRGIALIVVVAMLLMFSDWRNRRGHTNNRSSGFTTGTIRAEPGKFYSIGIAYFAPEESFDNLLNGLFDGLKDLGFIKDSNLIVILSHANGEIANIPSILQNLDNQPIDLLIPTSTPCLTAALTVVKNKPLVFTYVYDPIAAGAGTSYTEHRPNVTGVGSFPPIEKTIELIKALIPDIRSVGTIYNSSEANSRKAISVGRERFKKKGITLEEITVVNTNEVLQAAQVLVTKGIQLLWITGDNTALQAMDGIIKTADKSRIPVILNDYYYVSHGALAAAGIGWYGTGYHSAQVVARVLNGENVAGIPLENYAEEKIVINFDKAKILGINIPEKLKMSSMETTESKVPSTSKGRLLTLLKPDLKLPLQFALIQYNDAPLSELTRQGIIDGLTESGLVEGKDFTIRFKNAQGDITTLNSIINQVATEKNDILFVTSTPTLQATIRKIKNQSIVFTTVADPIVAGAGKSFSDHLPNVTGISTMGDYQGMARLLKVILPSARRIGTLYSPGEANSVLNLETFKKYAKQEGLDVLATPINTSSEVTDAALSMCSEKIDAICQILDNLTSASFTGITQVARKSKIPLFGFVSEQVEDGAILAVSRDYGQAGKDAVRLAIKILQGETPAAIPFEFVSKTNLIINLDAAKYYGVTIPEEVITKADKIIKKE